MSLYSIIFFFFFLFSVRFSSISFVPHVVCYMLCLLYPTASVGFVLLSVSPHLTSYILPLPTFLLAPYARVLLSSELMNSTSSSSSSSWSSLLFVLLLVFLSFILMIALCSTC